MTFKRLISSAICFFIVFSVSAQNSSLPYWQQEVNYKINVTLNDRTNELTGNIEIEYINHSPDNLTFIWFHLWPNAYKNDNTAFAKQELENGHTRFFYSKPEEKGYIDGLDFKVDGDNVQFTFDSIHIDIGKITLSEPLKSGGKITITTPFHVKLPYTFSRGGHVGQSYQISQWYPKPAVYDRKGWHPIPYLDQGEFYSEFGSYDVKITIPGNYVVGATGDLQNAGELKWLEEKSAVSKQKLGLEMSDEEKELAKTFANTPVDSSMKTLHYIQSKVHDFAWFANKNYYVLKGDVVLPNSKNHVTTWTMFTQKRASIWKNSIQYIDSATYYYSKWLGDYPYRQVSAVEGALAAGDGMEYPNITVIGDMQSAEELETVIVHEVGHNWLYGVLAFNERNYPWMDEGINSYYENRYTEIRYPNNLPFGLTPGLAKFLNMKNYKAREEKYLTYLFQERRHEDQPVNLSSEYFTEFNYDAIIYCKVPVMLIHLAAALGQNKFDSIMQKFYTDWQYKHPQPEDFRHEFETQTKTNLDGYFDQAMNTTMALDYKVQSDRDTLHIGHSVYRQIGIKNVGGVRMPYSISAIKNGKVVKTIWYGGFSGKMKVLFPLGDYDKYEIDIAHEMWESNRKNNIIRTHGLFRKTEPLHIQLFGSVENPERTQLFLSPVIGWNDYNGFMAGLVFYNSFLPAKNVEYQLAPMYAFGSQTPVGIGRVAFHFYPKGNLFHEIVFSVTGSHFSDDEIKYLGTNYFTDFSRVSGRLDFTLKKKRVRSPVTKGFTLRSVFIQQEFLEETEQSASLNPFNNLYTILSFHLNNNEVINPYSFSVNVENGITDFLSPANYTRAYAVGNCFINYNAKKTGLSVRVFLGTVLNESGQNAGDFNLGATTGTQDYLYDEAFLGRSETSGILSQQVIETQGFFKYRTDNMLTPIGNSTSIFAINLKTSLPFRTPFFLFADLGRFNVTQSSYSFGNLNSIQYDAGVGMTLIRNVINVYLPLAFSSDIKNSYTSIPEYNTWYKRILFTLNISKLNIFDKARQFNTEY